ncbi:MAG: hypothetical protein Q8O67_26325 [Deltaproteobacteria bacterium]|nr:hypothetical protein [Deltaproteobacteria bacterium]
MLTQQAAALAASGSAVVVVVVVALLVFLRRAPPAGPGDLSGRGRFPARAIERGVVAGIAALALAGLSIWEVDSDVQVGVAAVVVALVWLWWRGSFLPLRAGETPRG